MNQLPLTSNYQNYPEVSVLKILDQRLQKDLQVKGGVLIQQKLKLVRMVLDLKTKTEDVQIEDVG